MTRTFFEEELSIDTISELGNPLEQLPSLVDFEMFRAKEGLQISGWHPQCDVVLMFKNLFLQH